MGERKLTDGMIDVLRFVGASGFASSGFLYWNGPRRSNANRLVKRGLLTYRPSAPRQSEGYAITDAGRSALEANHGRS